MPRDVSLSDSKCWNGVHEWAKSLGILVKHKAISFYCAQLASLRDINSRNVFGVNNSIGRNIYSRSTYNCILYAEKTSIPFP